MTASGVLAQGAERTAAEPFRSGIAFRRRVHTSSAMNGHDDRGRDGPPENPRSEPEILPPERARGRGPRPYVWIWTADGSGAPRMTAPGVFAILLAFAFAGLVATVILLVALGAVLFWVPVIILVMSALVLSALFRQYWRRFRHWAFRR